MRRLLLLCTLLGGCATAPEPEDMNVRMYRIPVMPTTPGECVQWEVNGIKHEECMYKPKDYHGTDRVSR
jgi:hypothetical protein